MVTFKDFATWAGSQRKAADLIGVDKYRAHRLYHGAQIEPEEAMRVELASGGLFRKEQLVFGPLVKGNNNDQFHSSTS